MEDKKLSQEDIQKLIISDIPSNYTPPSWDVWYMRMVYVVASKSKDTSTKIGAVIVKNNRIVSVGYNGMPCGVDDSIVSRYDRPKKYMFFEHGERNSIYSAARNGIELDGAVMYTQGIPCCDCGRAVIQSGIRRVVVHNVFEQVANFLRSHWSESCEATSQMFIESGVMVYKIDELIDSVGYVNGKVIHV